jgi:hypothetical protein
MQSQCKHTSKKKQGPPRGFGDSQRNEILTLLRQAGPAGVFRSFLIFERHVTQCGTRVFELQKMGYVIRSEDRGGRYPTWYVLESEPLEKKHSLKTQAAKSNNEGRQKRQQCPAESASAIAKSPLRDKSLPLFDAVRQ